MSGFERMKCDILTLFPNLVLPVLDQSILKRAREKGRLEAVVHNLRDFTDDRHRTADDHPYGGGAGMVLKPEPVFKAVEHIRASGEPMRLILTSPQGRRFDQECAREFGRETRRLVFICGRYEGVDERVREALDPEEISIGDYVLTGGELAALVMIDASARWVPGVVGDPESVREDSFSENFLDYPNYTRPADFKGLKVPEILFSGDHEMIRIWRRKQAIRNTLCKRPDLLEAAEAGPEDRALIRQVKMEMEAELKVEGKDPGEPSRVPMSINSGTNGT